MSGPHTPGPWEYRLEGSRWVLYASGQPLALAGRTHRAIANRAQIEAAPDLLAALEAIVAAWDDPALKGVTGAAYAVGFAVRTARDAIAKARGETP